jgi:hypothetical protein
MAHVRRYAWSVVMGLALGAAGCRAAKTGPGVSAAAPIQGMGVPAPADVDFQAELAPINALAADHEFLWIGSDRGLRRVRLSDDKVEWLPLGGADANAGAGGASGTPLLAAGAAGADAGESGGVALRRVTALASGGDRSVWVGTDVGLGRALDVGGKLAFQLLVPMTGITQLAALRTPPTVAGRAPASSDAGGAESVWVGTDHGLFLVRRRIATVVPGVGKTSITFLTIDDEDGQAAWAGVRGRGLLRIEGQHVAREIGPAGPSPIDFLDPVGMARLANGTPFAIGRGRGGESKLVQLHPEGAEPLDAEPPVKVWALLSTETGPLVFAGEPGASAAYRLEQIERGQLLEPGAFRFVQGRRNLQGLRVAARLDSRALPAEATVWIAAAEGLFLGTRAAGVARLGDELVRDPGAAPVQRPVPVAGAVKVVAQTTTEGSTGTALADAGGPRVIASRSLPEYLPVGELAERAGALSVACIERERCVVATGDGPGWIWDGQTRVFRPVPTEALGGPLMALGGDGEGAVYFMGAEGPKGIRVVRLSSDGARWDPLITLQVSIDGAPVVSSATVSPQGSLWMSIRSRASSGEESGRGVIELQLPSGKAVHHHAARAGEPRSPEAIPISGDVRAVRFQPGNSGTPDAIWFCTSLGVLRSAEGKLTRWSENDGLSSDSCNDLAIVDGGATVWVATNRGPSRFDGKVWIPFDGSPPVTGAARRWPRARHGAAVDGGADEPDDQEDDLEVLAARAFVTAGGGLWAGTPRGIWPLTASGRPFDRDSGLVDENVRGLVIDRFGRLWVLGHLGLTVTGSFPRR